MWSRQYGADVLAAGQGRRRPGRREVPKVAVEHGLVVEDSEGRFCGAVVGYERGAVTLEGAGPLAEGDSVRFTATGGQKVTATEPAEILVWEMHATLAG